MAMFCVKHWEMCFSKYFPDSVAFYFLLAETLISLVSADKNWAGISDALLSLWDEDKFATIKMLQSHPWIWDSSMQD